MRNITPEFDNDAPTKEINSAQSILPLFVYQILVNYHTSEQKRLTQQQLISILEEYPYQIKVTRRALSRCIGALEYYTDVGIHSSTNGVWYDVNDDWFRRDRKGIFFMSA